jgi:hypothetical protein
LHIVATRRPFALNGWSKESEHNLEIPVKREFNDLLGPTAGKQGLLSNYYPHRDLSFLNMEEGEITWYMELQNNSKRVTTWMPGQGGLRRGGYQTETGNSLAI